MIRSRHHFSPAAHWVTLLIGLAVLLDVLWIASRLQPARASTGFETQQIAVSMNEGRTGPPSLHMHPVF